jgi:hypothetical protein
VPWPVSTMITPSGCSITHAYFGSGLNTYACVLHDHGEWGVESATYRNGELFVSYRFPTEALALEWAWLERTHIEEGSLD